MKENKLLKDYPDLLKEWDYELNSDVLTPEFLFAQSNKKYYWKCLKGHPSYLCSVGKKTIRQFGCPICSNHKIVAGINDFESNHPELMVEWNWEVNNKNGVFPSKLGPVSSHMASWKCKTCGNTWDASISNRVRMHSGCPYCSNLKVKKGFNDLETTNPEVAASWDYEKNGDKKPSDYVAGTDYKAWWKCEKGHSWRTSIKNRVLGRGCPICANKVVLVGYNDFKTTCPKAAKQWDYEKNGNKSPSNFTKGSETRVWFKCEKGHSWKTRIAERGKGLGCPYCSNQRILVGYNDFASQNPELLNEWDYEKNINISPKKFASLSNKRAWWKCTKCGTSWNSVISTRVKGYGCPKCGAERSTIGRLKKMASENWIFDKHPELEKEWDYEKNKNIDVSLITSASNKYAWWKCENGHSYRTRICLRTLHNVGCPYCHNQKVLTGINDLATLNPVLAAEWDYEKNSPLTPSDVFSHGSKSVWWKCPVCGHSWKSKINNRANARGCPNCSLAGTSFIEQSIYFYLKKCFPDAINRYKYKNVEMDIYIPSLNTAIEYDGSFFHNSNSAIVRENKKDDFCSLNGIRLIRLREKPLPFTKSAENIECDCSKWKRIEDTIAKLIAHLNGKLVEEISLRKDLPNIITSKRKLMKDRAFGKDFPNLLDEWDYEKNMPLIPDYFSKGSDAKVWWICKKEHSFQQKIANRCHGTGCPICYEERRRLGLHRKKQNL